MFKCLRGYHQSQRVSMFFLLILINIAFVEVSFLGYHIFVPGWDKISPQSFMYAFLDIIILKRAINIFLLILIIICLLMSLWVPYYMLDPSYQNICSHFPTSMNLIPSLTNDFAMPQDASQHLFRCISTSSMAHWHSCSRPIFNK